MVCALNGRGYPPQRVGFLEKLRGIQVSEGVGGEVPEAAHAPVDVLQASLSVVRRNFSKQFFEGCIPCGWDLVRLQSAVEEAAFDIEPEENVEIVSGLVRFDSDKRELSAMEVLDEVRQRNPAQVWEKLTCARKPTLPERGGSAYMVFPQAGLRFVDSEGDGASGRKTEVGRR